MIQRSVSSSSSFPPRLEFARSLSEVGQANGGLAEFPLAVHEHRNLAHLVDLRAVLLCPRFALAEEIDEDRTPIGADQIEHQRDAVGVSGLGKTVELVFGHSQNPCRGINGTASLDPPSGNTARNAGRQSDKEAAAYRAGHRGVSDQRPRVGAHRALAQSQAQQGASRAQCDPHHRTADMPRVSRRNGCA
jgi:hypothetical protein